MNLSAIKPISIILIFFVLGFGIYSNTLEAPFTFDDDNIYENPHIRINKLSEIGKVGLKSLSDRPVAFISFAFNYYFHQYNLKGYHVFNIIIHILTGMFLYLFIKTTLTISAPPFADPSIPEYFNPSLIAFSAALIWLVHPVQIQSVTYIVQRMNSMAAMFYLFSFLLYLKGRLVSEDKKRWPWFSGSALVWILSLGCKEMSATLPFFIFLYEWYFFQNLNKDWLKHHIKYFLGIMVLFGLVAFICLGLDPLEKLLSLRAFALKEFTFTERVLTQFRVVIYYLGLLLYPHPSRLNLDYDFPLSHSLIDPPTTLLCLFIIIGLVGLAVYIAKKNRLVSFCILWFFGNLIIESSVIPLDIIYEHRIYLPSMLVFLPVALFAIQHIKPRWAIVVLCAVVTICAMWTYERNRVWGDSITFWQDCVNKSPEKARPHINLGKALEDQGRKAEALNQYSKAVQLDPNSAQGHHNLGNILAGQGKFRVAEQHYAEALRVDPNYVKAHNNLGNTLASQGRFVEAARHYAEALRLDSGYVEAYNNLGNVLLVQGKIREAGQYYSEALRLNPNFFEAHNNLGAVLLRMGNVDKALTHFRNALRIKPGNAATLDNIRAALGKNSKIDEAIAATPDAPKYKSEDPVFYYDTAMRYQRNGEIDKAIIQYKKALSIQPDYPEALNNLAILYVSKGEYDQALPLFKQIIDIVPDHAGTYYNIACICAIQNKIEDAIDWLEAAVQKGYDNWELIKTDKDLENIRKSPYYKAFIKGH